MASSSSNKPDGIDELSIDTATSKMTVIDMVDPVEVVSKLRKTWAASIDSVGPAKVPEREGEKKKEEDGGKKDGVDAKKEGDGAKKEGEGGKKDGDAKDDAKDDGEKIKPTEQQLIAELMNQYRSAYAYQNPYYMNNHYVVQIMEENPNSCAIC